jgi:hypothetical protein
MNPESIICCALYYQVEIFSISVCILGISSEILKGFVTTSSYHASVHDGTAMSAKSSDLTIPASCAMVICSLRALAVTCRTCQCKKIKEREINLPQSRVLALSVCLAFAIP